jgi:hypothetical protein
MTNPYTPPNHDDLALDSYTNKITKMFRWKLEGAFIVVFIQTIYIFVTNTSIDLGDTTAMVLITLPILLCYDIYNIFFVKD